MSLIKEDVRVEKKKVKWELKIDILEDIKGSKYIERGIQENSKLTEH